MRTTTKNAARREAPTLETERLLLRPHGVDDLEACHRMWGDPAVVRHIGGKPSTLEETWARLLRYAGLWHLVGHGYWAVTEKATGRYAGDVGFGDFRRAMEPSLLGKPELGWVLDPAMQGRGYATEAVRAATAWSADHLDATTLCCIVAPDNAPSLRVATKSGFRDVARTTYQGSDVIVLERENRSHA